jgi:hypothetical protein
MDGAVIDLMYRRTCISHCRYILHRLDTHRYVIWMKILKGRDHSEDLGAWENNIKINLQETGLGSTDLIHLAQHKDQCRLCKHGNKLLIP